MVRGYGSANGRRGRLGNAHPPLRALRTGKPPTPSTSESGGRMNDEAYEAPYEILDLGPTRRVRWLHGSVRIPFFAGTADGLERTYATPPPLATSANRQRYVLAVAD